jgi:hypothetical protein
MSTEKPVRTLLFIVDTSWNMIDGGINTVNDAIGKVIAAIHNYLDSEQNTTFMISVLESSDASGYYMPDLKDITKYEWKGINANHSDAKISEAFKRLYEKLSNDESIGAYDGTPSLGITLIVSQRFDDGWETSLNNLFCNNQFGHAIRTAVVFGSESNDSCPTKASLLRFTSVKKYDDLAYNEPVTNEDGTYKHINNETAVVYRPEVESFRRAIIEESISAVNMLFGINALLLPLE